MTNNVLPFNPKTSRIVYRDGGTQLPTSLVKGASSTVDRYCGVFFQDDDFNASGYTFSNSDIGVNDFVGYRRKDDRIEVIRALSEKVGHLDTLEGYEDPEGLVPYQIGTDNKDGYTLKRESEGVVTVLDPTLTDWQANEFCMKLMKRYHPQAKLENGLEDEGTGALE